MKAFYVLAILTFLGPLIYNTIDILQTPVIHHPMVPVLSGLFTLTCIAGIIGGVLLMISRETK